MSNELSQFLDQQVLPRLFEQLDGAFPEMGWKRTGRLWVATNEEWSRREHSARPDRVNCYEDSKHCYVVQGGDTAITWLSYVIGGATPRGRDFVTAVSRLAAKVGLELPEDEQRPQAAKRFSIEWARRQVTTLRDTPAALAWLTKTRGFSAKVIERFYLGLSVKPMGPDGQQYEHALAFPHVGANGKPVGHYYYCDVPGVTRFDAEKDHRKGATWGKKLPGSPLYYNGTLQGKKRVLLVEGFKDLFAVCTLLEGDDSAKDLLVVTATHGAGSTLKTPELTSPTWWQQFDTIYLGLDNDAAGQNAVNALLPFIPKPAVVPLIPDRFATKEGKRADWNDLLLRGTRDDFKAVLRDAKPLSVRPVGLPTVNGKAVEFEEVDVQVAYHGGFLYWPFEMPIRTEEGGKVQEEFRTFVLRSDGLMLDIHESPRVSDRGRGIKRLSDGTPILRVPRPVRTSQTSWHWSSVRDFVESARGKQLELLPRPRLGDLVEKIYRHLRASVWLPYREDYATVSLGIVTSYCQEIFDAVPLFMLVGERGSGKTELSTHAASLGCNGRSLGRTTVAGLMEACDRFRGLVAVDDFEELGARTRNAGNDVINDMAQVIKQSYKKSGGTHTRVGDGELVERNLFGVKFLNNTLGADPITLSRMFCIRTRRIAEETKNQLKQFAGDILTPAQITELRNQIHVWIYSNVPTIAGLAAELKRDKVNRDDEIALPLRVLAKLAELPYVVADLEAAITRRLNANTETDEETALRESLRSLVAEGHDWISVYHVMNEMATHLSPTFGADSKSDLPEWQRPHVLGKRLLGFWLDENQQKRMRLEHRDVINFRPRFYRVLDDRRTDLLNELAKENAGQPPMITPKKAPGDFCTGCEACRYRERCFIRHEYAAKSERGAN